MSSRKHFVTLPWGTRVRPERVDAIDIEAVADGGAFVVVVHVRGRVLISEPCPGTHGVVAEALRNECAALIEEPQQELSGTLPEPAKGYTPIHTHPTLSPMLGPAVALAFKSRGGTATIDSIAQDTGVGVDDLLPLFEDLLRVGRIRNMGLGGASRVWEWLS